MRPDPLFGNIVEVVSDARSRQHEVQFAMTVNPGALLPAFNAPLIKWKRDDGVRQLHVAELENNSDGAFATPATGSLDDEWGSAPFDVPHRFNVTFNNQIVRNLLLEHQLQHLERQSLHDPHRPRRQRRSDLQRSSRRRRPQHRARRAQWTLNVAAAYTIAFGRQTTLPPGIGVIGGGGGPQVVAVNNSGARFRLQFVVQVQNVTNNANYVGYSGVLHVAVLRPAHVRARHSEGGHGCATELLVAASIGR